MNLLLLAALAAPIAVHPVPARHPAAAAPQHCAPPAATFAVGTARPPGAQKLGEQPPAALYLAVVREVAGCPTPAVVRTGIGR